MKLPLNLVLLLGSTSIAWGVLIPVPGATEEECGRLGVMYYDPDNLPAGSVGIKLTIDDFQSVSDKTPFLADLKPSGKYVMHDLCKIGGTPALLRFLLKERLINGSGITVTGKTMKENVASWPDFPEDQRIIRLLSDPIEPTGHLQGLRGFLAPGGSVGKITGKEVYDSKGCPGMPEMLKPSVAIMGAGLGQDVALLTYGRFSSGSHGFLIGHIVPEAMKGGPIALVKNGVQVIIDAEKRVVDLQISAEEMERRKKEWKAPQPRAKQGPLKKYAALISDASHGCATDGPL
ncbi:hypothetical protein CNMCM6106_005811 [Aspergillus hiratsukae]|uniref:Dihydroxy-acid dehydratase n=1 Tax=Aspergillus hiratsukae TaxID=1194566 RepID=A0A8H6PR96_9EURO|nr:hypothetical protein CNMCM6106_005811 [Aspergillus hiratsukae]